MPTPAEIEAARSPAGGWTRATLAGWGVPWPPPKGWKWALEHGLCPVHGIPDCSPLLNGCSWRPNAKEIGMAVEGWIAVTNWEAVKKESPTFFVRADSIDAMTQRSTYTTLLIHGHYLHVKETVEELRELIRPQVPE